MAIRLLNTESGKAGMLLGPYGYSYYGVQRNWPASYPWSVGLWWRPDTVNGNGSTIFGRPTYPFPTWSITADKRIGFSWPQFASWLQTPADYVVAGAWYHLLYVAEGSGENQSRVYIHGSKSVLTSDVAVTTDSVFAWGSFWDGYSENQATFDDLAVWSEALDDDDVANIIERMDGHQNYRPSALVQQWRWGDSLLSENGGSSAVFVWNGSLDPSYAFVDGIVSYRGGAVDVGRSDLQRRN